MKRAILSISYNSPVINTFILKSGSLICATNLAGIMNSQANHFANPYARNLLKEQKGTNDRTSAIPNFIAIHFCQGKLFLFSAETIIQLIHQCFFSNSRSISDSVKEYVKAGDINMNERACKHRKNSTILAYTNNNELSMNKQEIFKSFLLICAFTFHSSMEGFALGVQVCLLFIQFQNFSVGIKKENLNFFSKSQQKTRRGFKKVRRQKIAVDPKCFKKS